MSPLHGYLEGLSVDGDSLDAEGGLEESGKQEGCYLGDEVLGGGGVAVVNLDRKLQRWEYVQEALRKAGVTRFARVSAADGRSLRGDTAPLQWLFRRNHFKV